MNKKLSKIVLALVFAQNFVGISLGTQGYVNHAYTKDTSVVIPRIRHDYRVDALRRMFEKYDSPLAPYARNYVESADKYGVDWRLLPAISGLESTFGKHLMSGSHNGYGWGGGLIYFTSWEDGIDKINSTLASNYYKRGARDVWSIGPIYAESPTWSVRVDRFMKQIDAQLAEVETRKAPLTI